MRPLKISLLQLHAIKSMNILYNSLNCKLQLTQLRVLMPEISIIAIIFIELKDIKESNLLLQFNLQFCSYLIFTLLFFFTRRTTKNFFITKIWFYVSTWRYLRFSEESIILLLILLLIICNITKNMEQFTSQYFNKQLSEWIQIIILTAADKFVFVFTLKQLKYISLVGK